MTRHRDVGGLYPMRYLTPALFLIVSCFVLMRAPRVAVAQKAQARVSVAIKDTHFFLFDLVPGGNYDVSKNGGASTPVSGSAAGSVTYSSLATSGDRYVFILSGVSAQPPSVPTGVSAQGNNTGCAAVTWNANPESDVTGYTLYFGSLSGQYSDSVVVANVTSRTVCGLANGTYFFALRARNLFGLPSTLSTETSTVVSNGNTQGPLPPQQVQLNESTPGCVSVTWQPSSGPTIAGYVLYHGAQSVGQGGAAVYTDSIDVGNVATATICSLGQGTRYFALRAYTTSLEYSVYSTEKSIVVIGADVTPPSVSGLTPVDGQTLVPTDPQIFFMLSDSQSGVDTNSVVVTINGQPPARTEFSGSPASYGVVCVLSAPLPAQSLVSIAVSAADRASTANAVSMTWSFTTGSAADSSPPEFCCESPVPGAVDVDPSSMVVVGVSDPSGVDFMNITFKIDGKDVPYVWNVDAGTVRFENSAKFVPGATINVTVVACDRSSSAHCATHMFSFDVSMPVATASAEPGTIVPDGFWADDASRPLEVRNLPRGWTVRIFDTSGLQIRSYRNTERSGLDWFWDFANEGGRQVAQALYLIRIVDDSGVVRRAGRFLVHGRR